jgi:hypothetical protein
MGDLLKLINIKNLLAALAMLGCLSIVAALINHAIPDSNKEIFNILSALFFNTVLGAIMRNYFPPKETNKP